MSRWKRVVRGMLGMGLTFAAAAGVFFTVVAVTMGLFFPGAESDLPFMIVAGSTWAFAIGVAFSGTLAIAGRHLSFDQLSITRVAVLGAGGGLVLAGLLVGATLPSWTFRDALVPLVALPVLGAVSSTASLLMARSAGPALAPGEESGSRRLSRATAEEDRRNGRGVLRGS